MTVCDPAYHGNLIGGTMIMINKAHFLHAGVLLAVAGALLLFPPIHVPRQGGERFENEGESEAPGIDHYLFPRRYNSSVSISAGLDVALAQKSSQLRALALRKAALTTSWKCIGPDNMAGRVICVKYHPTNPNVVFCGSAAGGLWKSIDGGASWAQTANDLPTLAVSCIAFDKSDPNVMYIGTGEGAANFDRVYGDGVYKSTDGGSSWTNIMKNVVPNVDLCINWIEQNPSQPDILYVAAAYGVDDGGVFRSTDRGNTWQKTLSGAARKVMVDPFFSNRVLAGIAYYKGSLQLNGLYVSENYGAPNSYMKLTDNLPTGDSIGNLSFDFSPARSGAVIAMLTISYQPTWKVIPVNDLRGIYQSSDGGAHWVKIDQSSTPEVYSMLNGQGWYNLYIRCNPTKPGVVFAGGLDNWMSTDFGSTWTQISLWYAGIQGSWADQHGMDFSPADPNTMLICSDGGIFGTTFSASGNYVFQEMGTGLVTMQFYAMDYAKDHSSFVAGGTQDRGTNGGYQSATQWYPLYGGDGGYTVFDYADSLTIYAETQFGGVYKSVDQGISFYPAYDGFEFTRDSASLFAFIPPYIMHPTDHNTLFMGANVIYCTTDAATLWRPISGDLTGEIGNHFQMQALALCKSKPDYIYGVTGAHPRVFRTRNASAPNPIWDSVTTGLPGLYLASVAVHPVDGEIVYVGTSAFDPRSGVYKSTNGGSQWTFMHGSTAATTLPNIPVNALAILEKNPEVVFAGTDIGVYVSTNGGGDWLPYGTNLPNVVVNDIKITPDGILYAATHGRGMWMTDLVLATNGVPSAVPEQPLLGRNYPNPVSVSTTIPFTLPNEDHLTLRLFDSGGKLVKTLLDGELPAGAHSYKLNAAGLRPGVYFYTIRCGSRSESRKLAVLR